MHAVVGQFRIEVGHTYSPTAPDASKPWRASARIYHRGARTPIRIVGPTRWFSTDQAADEAAVRAGVDIALTLQPDK